MTCAKVVGVFCLLVFAAISSSSHQVLAEDRATRDKNAVMKKCGKHIHKKLGDPFPKLHGECCRIVRESPDVHAICEKFTREDLAKIALWKWVHVTQMCGNGLATGSDCAGKLISIYSIPVIQFPLFILSAENKRDFRLQVTLLQLHPHPHHRAARCEDSLINGEISE